MERLDCRIGITYVMLRPWPRNLWQLLMSTRYNNVFRGVPSMVCCLCVPEELPMKCYCTAANLLKALGSIVAHFFFISVAKLRS